MSEAVSLDFLGLRLDSVQNDVRDLRLRVVGLAERFGTLEQRFSAMEARFTGLEGRMAAQESRMDRVVFLLERIAQAQGIADP